MRRLFVLWIMGAVLLVGCARKREEVKQNWTHYVRIAGHGLRKDNIDEIIRSATETYVEGIETDNSLTGIYESFLNPTEKLEAMKEMAEKAHAAGKKVFVYTEGLEIITPNAEQKEHTFFKDHPDWAQRDIHGRPAVFGGGTAFWIKEGDEDVWISPYAADWRRIYMERIRQIAATGMDGVFVDIPYWMTHFEGWEDTWASFDDYTVAAFKKATGLDARTDLKLGDFSDPNFRKWVDFRIQTLTDFMKEVAENGRSVNPNFITIAEIYPGIEEAAVRVGADVYEMYRVVDVIAHEYNPGGKSADRDPSDWFAFMTGMYSFRAFAEGKASWMLTYSWENHEKIRPADAMENLMVSQLMAGANCWDAANHVMSGSNDYEARKRIFKWIADHERTFYRPRGPMRPIGVYFSPKTRNYFADEFIRSYRGVMYLLLQSHLEFQIVTPRTLRKFRGPILILPEVRCVADSELAMLRRYMESGNALYLTGETGSYDDQRQLRAENPILEWLGIRNPDQPARSSRGKTFVYQPECTGRKYYEAVLQEYDECAYRGEYQNARFEQIRQAFVAELVKDLGYIGAVQVSASPFVSSQIAVVDGKPHVFLANFKGLKGRENANQLPEKNVAIRFTVRKKGKVYALEFLGEPVRISAMWEKGQLSCVIPEIRRGMVVWVE
ncbi:MAG: hypothetical protein ONB23_10835 [candidate division KSB1 bacterium]|nr:hypothetical protein [candidate division KSB1 bacterium]